MSAGKKGLGASPEQNAPKDAVATTDNNVPSLTVDEMVLHINNICRTSVNGGKIQIGEYLLVNVFKGDITKASSKDPKKGEDSYAQIAKSSDLDLTDKELGICLRVAVLERLLKEADEKLCGLKFSVKREIIKLPSTDQMLKLARVAYDSNLTVEGTRKELTAMMPPTNPDLGQKVLNGLKSSPLALVSKEELKGFCQDKDRLMKDLNRKERTKIRKTATDKLAEIEECVSFLKGLEKTLGEIDAA
jgi:hypothetical protein